MHVSCIPQHISCMVIHACFMFFLYCIPCTFHVSCMKHAWNMHEFRTLFIHETCMNHAWTMHGMKHAWISDAFHSWNMHEPCMNHAWHETCMNFGRFSFMKHAWFMHKAWKFEYYMRESCRNRAWITGTCFHDTMSWWAIQYSISMHSSQQGPGL